MGYASHLKLFKIDDGNEPVYFNSKRAAKHKRDILHAEGRTDIVVMRGPDHRKGESFNKPEHSAKRAGGW